MDPRSACRLRRAIPCGRPDVRDASDTQRALQQTLLSCSNRVPGGQGEIRQTMERHCNPNVEHTQHVSLDMANTKSTGQRSGTQPTDRQRIRPPSKHVQVVHGSPGRCRVSPNLYISPSSSLHKY
ncbi:hypothetical protein MAR_036954 [Mya arenaria]|uniref:Uncharacterized protein n=1 Tax=Mya arenaria TaxID=6604 RepID=A0ABY7FM63_MYAAR|nr:hypothetical protein MAR_036954 [Mya arenaria]